MQTFLPYSSYSMSAKVLDNKRLGKQRVECLQLLTTLHLGEGKWFNHPCTRMWNNYESELIKYGVEVCNEWRARGFVDNCLPRIQEFTEFPDNGPPPWLGREDFHSSHRAALLFKLPAWYGKFGWEEKAEINYIWPVERKNYDYSN